VYRRTEFRQIERFFSRRIAPTNNGHFFFAKKETITTAQALTP
jgi:hypothetical protein